MLDKRLIQQLQGYCDTDIEKTTRVKVVALSGWNP